MDSFVQVIDGQIICTKQNHNAPIFMIIIENDVQLQDRLLCKKCYEAKIQITQKNIGIQQAQNIISEKLRQSNYNTNEKKREIITKLKEFQQQIQEFRTLTIKYFSDIEMIIELWIQDVENFGKVENASNFLQQLELLNSDNVFLKNNVNELEKINQSHNQKTGKVITSLRQTLSDFIMVIDKFNLNTQNQTQVIEQNENIIKITEHPQLQRFKSVEFSHSIKQEEWAKAIVFNNTGTLMVTGCDEDINVWQFDNGNLQKCKRLSGDKGIVQCLAFSANNNWFASGCDDGTVQCWKEESNNEWIRVESEKQHISQVLCLLITQQQQIISCSRDKTIRVWSFNHQDNKLIFDYTLSNAHQKEVFGISLNAEESELVSCSSDRQIILWTKGQNNLWICQSSIIMEDTGYRISFINQNLIAWQQYSKGITHILESKNEKLHQKQTIILNQDQFDVSILFPTIYNKKRQVIIQKHNKYVYILQNRDDTIQSVSPPIECSHQFSYGALTEDGEYLVIWNYNTKVFRFYNILYE